MRESVTILEEVSIISNERQEEGKGNIELEKKREVIWHFDKIFRRLVQISHNWMWAICTIFK